MIYGTQLIDFQRKKEKPLSKQELERIELDKKVELKRQELLNYFGNYFVKFPEIHKQIEREHNLFNKDYVFYYLTKNETIHVVHTFYFGYDYLTVNLREDEYKVFERFHLTINNMDVSRTSVHVYYNLKQFYHLAYDRGFHPSMYKEIIILGKNAPSHLK
jgi:hypothetical protein